MFRYSLAILALLVVAGCSLETETASTNSPSEGGGETTESASALPSAMRGIPGADLAGSPVGGNATSVPAKPPVRPAPPATGSGNSNFPTELNPPSNAQLPPGLSPVGQASGGTREKAGVGSGKQGRSLDNETGIGAMIVQPARSLFAVRERTVFEIQIPQALQLFQALQGRGPKSHEEFMTHIIDANNIKLPELPAGHRYQFDPQRGELMVEKPGG